LPEPRPLVQVTPGSTKQRPPRDDRRPV